MQKDLNRIRLAFTHKDLKIPRAKTDLLTTAVETRMSARII